MNRTYGIDISHNQAIGSSHNIRDYYNDGATFIIAKATQRDTYKDPGFHDHMRQMLEIPEVIPGAYHWITDADGAKQARHFVKTVKEATGGRTDIIWAFDLEKAQRQYGDKQPKFSTVVDFVHEFYKLVPNRPLFCYTNIGAWGYFKEQNPNLAQYGVLLWNAYWTAGNMQLSDAPAHDNRVQFKPPQPDHFGGWGEATIVQMTSSGHSHGYRLDVDVYDGTPQQLRSLIKSGGSGNEGGNKCPDGYHKDSSGTCVPNTADCPDGYHKDANGVCVADSGGDGGGTPTDEPWDQNQVQDAGIAAANIAGLGGLNGVIVLGAIIVVVVVLFMAYQAGGVGESVIDHGEKD